MYQVSELIIVGLLLVGYTALSVWGYRVAAEQGRMDAEQAKRDGLNAARR